MLSSVLLALAASASTVAATAVQGFNVASNGNDQATFEANFEAASNLPGASGFNSMRLYTMIQDGTANTPISAIPAAIASKGTLLLGMWASAGQAAFDNEITALKAAISQYGQDFAKAVVGISVGSEDLYRITYTSMVTNKDPNPGASPDTLVSYIKQVKAAIAGTVLEGKLVGHVDVYTAFINGSNRALIDAADFLGMNSYPYYQKTVPNSIDNAYDLFFSDFDQTVAVSGGKPVWVTETGWPYAGKTSNLAVPSIKNAETFWKKVGCALFGKTNVWWYTLADGGSKVAFGIAGTSIENKPLFDLSCPSSSTSITSDTTSIGTKQSGIPLIAPVSTDNLNVTTGGGPRIYGSATATPKNPGAEGSGTPYPSLSSTTPTGPGSAKGTGIYGTGTGGHVASSLSNAANQNANQNAGMGIGLAVALGLIALL